MPTPEQPVAGRVDSEATADIAFHAVRAPTYDRDVTSSYAIYDELALGPLLDRAGAGPGTRVLDVGCGTGAATVVLAARGATVTGVDHSPDMVAVAREKVARAEVADRVTFEIAGAGALPFEDASFDGVTCQRVLHHISDPGPVLAEIARVLVPGGWLCLSDSVADPTPAARILKGAWRRVLDRRAARAGDPAAADALPGIVEAERTVEDLRRLLRDAGFDPELRAFTHVDLRGRLSPRGRAAAIRALSYFWRTTHGDLVFAFARKPPTR